jgi:hypothetical protein
MSQALAWRWHSQRRASATNCGCQRPGIATYLRPREHRPIKEVPVRLDNRPAFGSTRRRPGSVGTVNLYSEVRPDASRRVRRRAPDFGSSLALVHPWRFGGRRIGHGALQAGARDRSGVLTDGICLARLGPPGDDELHRPHFLTWSGDLVESDHLGWNGADDGCTPGRGGREARQRSCSLRCAGLLYWE